jgi:hypothetical protein
MRALSLKVWRPAPIRHIITLLGGSLEILRVNGAVIETCEILASIPHPRLTFFEISTIGVPTHDYLAAFRNIRTLIIHSLGPDPVPPTTLPHLTYLSAPWTIGQALLPGRPVRTYRMAYDYHLASGPYINGPLVGLEAYAQHVTELHVWLRVSPWGLAAFLASHFPNIVRLYLKLTDLEDLDDGRWPGPRAKVHRSLKEFDVGFDVSKRRPFPREECKRALTKLTLICPALEVVRFGALLPVNGGCIDEIEVPLDWLMDMRRTMGGDWQERKWGAATPVPRRLRAHG